MCSEESEISIYILSFFHVSPHPHSVNQLLWTNFLANREHAFRAIKLLKSCFIHWHNVLNTLKTRISWANVSISASRTPEFSYYNSILFGCNLINRAILLLTDKEAVEKRLFILQKQGHNIYTKTNELFT